MLIYLCGDNDLEPCIDADLAEICRLGSRPDIHVVAVIFSGLGISPRYVRQRLRASAGATAEPAVDFQVQQQLFSICHDMTSHDALEAYELHLTDDRWPFDRKIAQCGFPVAAADDILVRIM